MTDADQFVGFLVRAAASYHVPPEAPAGVMWRGIEKALAALAIEAAVEAEESRDEAVEPPTYHEPPEPPREIMWERIEAAWTMRRSAPEGSREAGLIKLEPAFAPDPPAAAAPRERRTVALWLSGVAAAAALIFGILIGRGTTPSGVGEAQLAAGRPELAEASAGPRSGTADLLAEPLTLNTQTVAFDDPPVEPLETSRELVVARTMPPPLARAGGPAEPASDADAEVARLNRRNRVAQHATDAHLDRAETLFAAFRVSDTDPGDLGLLARSARDLLGETRLLLAMSVERPARERALLEDIELVLAQIARLGPDLPDFERELAYEGIGRLGSVTGEGRIQPRVGT